MNTSALAHDARVANVQVTDASLIVELRDGREIRAPLRWFPRLAGATPAERSKWEICAGGHGVHWPLIDEDLSVEGLLRGEPAPQ